MRALVLVAIPRGGRSSMSSFLCTKALHQRDNLLHVPAVDLVGFRACRHLSLACLLLTEGGDGVT
jgi:hypothetical protein